MNILVLNGPNLNLLGEREPLIYGTTSLQEIHEMMLRSAGKDVLEFFQSNHEGALIDVLQTQRHWLDALILNPGALTHYSYSLRDAVSTIGKPTIEVHISNLATREDFRQISVFDGLPNVRKIMGRGAQGYIDAMSMLRG